LLPKAPRGDLSHCGMVDHQAFPWQDQRWQAGPLSAAVLYELHISSKRHSPVSPLGYRHPPVQAVATALQREEKPTE
jgi:hypothetical protein